MPLTYPTLGQEAPDFWNIVLKDYIDGIAAEQATDPDSDLATEIVNRIKDQTSDADSDLSTEIISLITGEVGTPTSDLALEIMAMIASTRLKSTDVLASSAVPVIGKINKYDSTSANRAPTLPALSGLTEGDQTGVQKTDGSTHTVTISCAGADTFDNTATALTLKYADLRILQVVVIGGTKFWKIVGGNTPQSSITAQIIALALSSATADSASLVVDKPSGVLEGRVIFQYGPSRGVIGAATRIHYDRIKGRIGASLFSNQSVGGHQAADTCTRMFGSPLSVVQGTAADSATVASSVGTWLNKAMWAGILLWWPFGNDALWDGAPGSASTTAKARASAANALHAGICLARSEQRIEGYLTLSVTTTNGSPDITGSSGNKWYRGMLVTATGVPANTYVGTILSATSFKLSSSRTSQVNVNATASGTVTGALSAPTTGTWGVHTAATAPDLYFSGNSYAKTIDAGATRTYEIWVDAADTGRRYWWVTAGIDDAEYVAVAGAPFGGTGGSTYSVSVDGGTAITGTTSDEHRWTGIAGGLTYGATFGQKAVDLGVLTTGQHSIVITNTGAAGKLLMDDCVLVESLTPMTVQLMKEVQLPALYYATATAIANGASYAKTQIYNAIIDTEVAKWPNDQSVLANDISADDVNGHYDPALHISTIDGLWAHFNDPGERLVSDKLMGWWNKLPDRSGLTRI